MKRRQFLEFAGLSTAALFFNRSAVLAAPGSTLQFPNHIDLLKDGQWMSLDGSREHWTLNDLAVDLQHTATGFRILLHAPSSPLEKLRLSWNWSFPAAAGYLGDAWERSYGDLSWIRPASSMAAAAVDHPLDRRAPWYMLVYDGRQTHAFGVKTGARSFCCWQATPNRLALVLDTHSGGVGVRLGDRTLEAAEIVTTQSTPGESPFQTDHRFCKLMCDHPRLPQRPVYGINDWYFAYGNNSRDLILKSTGMMSELVTDTDNRPFSVIDDGWENIDFNRGNVKFGDMAAMASEIKKLGMRPGLWTRPLLAGEIDKSTNIIRRPGYEKSKERYLDPTIPENLHRVGEIVRLYRHWGFEMVKHDYSTYDALGRWGSQMQDELTVPGWQFHDRSRTTAEILLDLYKTIREAANPMYLIGCNTVSHLSAGLFELNRIGDDTSGRNGPAPLGWASTPWASACRSTMPSTPSTATAWALRHRYHGKRTNNGCSCWPAAARPYSSRRSPKPPAPNNAHS